MHYFNIFILMSYVINFPFAKIFTLINAVILSEKLCKHWSKLRLTDWKVKLLESEVRSLLASL